MTDPTLEGRLARAQGDDAESRAHNAGQAAATYARECQRLRDRLAAIERQVRELDEIVNASLAAVATNPKRLEAMQDECRARIRAIIDAQEGESDD